MGMGTAVARKTVLSDDASQIAVRCIAVVASAAAMYFLAVAVLVVAFR
jgi:hypothetical protein